MTEPKTIKRYANRKLYDTERSCYVTLEDISAMIKAGEEVKVIDNKNGDDLTSVTLAQIIFETEKKKGFMPIGLLQNLIRQSGDSISGFARDRVESVQEQARTIAEQAQRVRTDFGGKIGHVFTRTDKKTVAKSQKQLRIIKEANELFDSTQKNLEEMQRSIEERVRGGMGTVSTNLGSAIGELRRRLEALEERLERNDPS